jgi:transcription termination/antitermination protein NusG
MEEMKWYVIRCSSGKEKKAKKHIESEIEKQNLKEFVNRLIIPTRKEIYVKSGKKVSRDVNYYPGYLLVEANLNDVIQHIIKETSGVLNILGGKDKSGKDKPEPLRNDEIKKILGKIDDSFEDGEKTKFNFIIGENVIIAEGPFTNFNGTVEEINEDKKRVKVAIKIFGRKTPVELEFSQIIKN